MPFVVLTSAVYADAHLIQYDNERRLRRVTAAHLEWKQDICATTKQEAQNPTQASNASQTHLQKAPWSYKSWSYKSTLIPKMYQRLPMEFQGLRKFARNQAKTLKKHSGFWLCTNSFENPPIPWGTCLLKSRILSKQACSASGPCSFGACSRKVRP